MTFVLNSPQLMQIAEKKFTPDLVKQMNLHRYLAIVCLVIGSLWSLQNIWQGDVTLFASHETGGATQVAQEASVQRASK